MLYIHYIMMYFFTVTFYISRRSKQVMTLAQWLIYLGRKFHFTSVVSVDVNDTSLTHVRNTIEYPDLYILSLT